MSEKKKQPHGRPTKYSPALDQRAYRMALLGVTDAELADVFDVSEATINNWKLKHPSFLESYRAGKDDADAGVAQSLYQQAMNGNTTAAMYWLKNRQPQRWRDKQEIDHTSGGEKLEPTRIVFEGLKAEEG